MSKTTVIVPCFNEAGRFGRECFDAFLRREPDVGLVFVDDGSTDGTAEMLAGPAEAHPERAVVVSHTVNRGKAEAVRTGVVRAIEGSGVSYVGYWDADLSTPLETIPLFVQALAAHPDWDVVMGTRLRRLGASIDRSLRRHLMGRVFATAVSMMLDLPVYDSQCGAKLFRRDIAAALFRDPFVSRWFFDVELLARYIRLFGRERALSGIYEYPLPQWHDDGDTRLELRDFMRVPLDLWRIRRQYGGRVKTSARRQAE